MPEIELLQSGEGEYRLQAPDALRRWMRDRERRQFVGPWRVSTSKALRGFDDDSRELRILRAEIDPGRTIVGRTAKA